MAHLQGLLRTNNSFSTICLRCRKSPVQEGISQFSTSTIVGSKKKHKYYNDDKVQSEDDLNLPLQFTPTGVHKITPTFMSPQDDRPWSQNYSISFSLALFCIYFFYLREENDIDERMRGLESQSLYERVEGLEKNDLLTYRAYSVERGLSTKEIDARLAILEAEELEKRTARAKASS